MSKIPEHDSRLADKFVIRMKPGQRDRLKVRAQAENQSMNDAAVTAIDKHLDHGEAFDELLRIVRQSLKPQGGAFVSIRRDYLQAMAREMIQEGLDEKSEHMAAALAVLGGDV